MTRCVTNKSIFNISIQKQQLNKMRFQTLISRVSHVFQNQIYFLISSKQMPFAYSVGRNHLCSLSTPPYTQRYYIQRGIRSVLTTISIRLLLTHWGRDEVDNISQATLSNVFFFQWKCLNFEYDFTDVCSQGSNLQYSGLNELTMICMTLGFDIINTYQVSALSLMYVDINYRPQT